MYLPLTLLIIRLSLLVIATQNSHALPHVFHHYNSYNSIIQFLNKLKRDNPDKVSSMSIDTTGEGHGIPLVKVAFRRDEDQGKPIILIDAGMHAREWMTIEVVLYLIQELVENELNEYMLLNVDWYFLPLLNPDGYAYSREEDRYWRKNRALGYECDGVDINRNFGFHWGEHGASKSECNENYAGPHPFSELETRALKNVTLQNKNNIKLYVSLHTYGEMIVYPWGYKNKSVSREFEEEHNNLGNLVAEAINAVRGSNYRTGRQSDILYVASGISIDWMAAVANIPLNFIIELTSRVVKFTPKPKEIVPTSQEIFQGFKVFHQYVETKWLPNNRSTERDDMDSEINGRDTDKNYKRIYKTRKHKH